MEPDKTLVGNKPETPFPIVGIGSSAGGLHSLDCFLKALPKDFDFAVVFIQHLLPEHKSLMPELLRSKWRDLEFIEIEDGLHLLPGKLYLCPPASEVRIHKGAFRVVARHDGHIHFPVDEFLVSLAEDVAERAVAVLFSGAGTDGVRGIQAVRTEGGTVFVQDPATAQFPELPRAAISTGQVDIVLPPVDIAREITKLLSSGAVTEAPDKLINSSELEPFYLLIREKTGHRFNHYKNSVVSRRIRRRMCLKGIASATEYLNVVADKPGEAALLASDLMIGVTSFFRDRLAWKALRIGVIRKLVISDGGAPIRVWTPACATGEESYSIAMMLRSELDLAGKKKELQVFATDVNDRALDKAREGKYPASISADVPQEFMRKFFTYSDDGISVTVNKELRQHVIFAKQDLLTDPPFSRLDLIICRNLLIYLEPEAQEKCITLFHYALKPGRYLFLGNAESLGRKSRLFKSLAHKKCRVYEKVETEPSSRLLLTVPFAAERAEVFIRQQSSLDQAHSFIQLSQDFLLEKYGPAAVTINQNYEILYHNGTTHRYLRQPRGAPTQNLFELVPENLRNRIRGAIYKATQEGGTFSIRAGTVGNEGDNRQVSIDVSKINDNLFLIVFREKKDPPSGASSEPLEIVCMEEPAVRQLEIELSSTRQELQTNIEQLKSLNEEFHSSNEELQASNEELETSREELQSLNEELVTVNTQLQSKVEEQEQTNNDMNNFLASTNIPTIFLDHRFRVKRYTPAITRLIKLIPSDVGRQIIDMSQESLGPHLIADAQSVLDNLVPVKKEIRINSDWYVRNALPYRTLDDHIEGVVVTYNDVTELKRAEERSSHLASFPQLNPNPIIEIDFSGTVIFCNPGGLETLGTLGMDKEDVAAFLPKDLNVILKDMGKNSESSIFREVAVRDKVFGETIHLIPQFGVARIYAYDITEIKKAENELREVEKRVRYKLESLLSPEGDIGDLDLADIIDASTIQILMDDFYKLTHMPMSIIDVKGKVLVGVGWQEICLKFHRVHPEACGHCLESDLELTADIPPGEFKIYKCKNNMWDIATPIMVAGKLVGRLFMGQFFFDDEVLAYDLFRSQAKQYGFNEEEYLAALDRVPRLGRAAVDTAMGFFMKLSGIISKLSYSNIKLARTLAERDRLMTSLRESEGRLEKAQEIAHLGSWELELVQNKLTWSDEVYRIFGLQPQEFGATYEAFLERIHPEDRAAVEAAYSGSLREGRAYEIEHRVVRKSDGEVRIVHEKCEHFRDDYGAIIRSIGMVHDVTKRKRAEDEIKRLNNDLIIKNKELGFTNKELESFIYSISHDLRGPLRAIYGFSGIIMKENADNLDEKGKRYLSSIHDSTEKMSRLVDDLLDLSRLSRQEIQRREVNVSDIAASIVTELREAHPGRSVEVDIKEGLTVFADPGLIEIVLSNLIGNAWKFTAKTERARIEFGTIEQDGKITHYVRDNGAGFNQKYAGKMFWPFHRLHSEAAFEGTGIGLAIVERIIHRHGGKVWAEGIEGKGATIYFSLI
jgi:PAS domain S-box-containing protein